MNSEMLELSEMQAAAGQACRLMKVLANADRLMILCQLSLGEKRVGELEEMLGILQPTLSQQLTVLREEGLVDTRREGKHIHYRLTSPRALALMQVLHEAALSLPDFVGALPRLEVCHVFGRGNPAADAASRGYAHVLQALQEHLRVHICRLPPPPEAAWLLAETLEAARGER